MAVGCITRIHFSAGAEILLFAIASRPVLGSAQPGSEFDHFLPPRAKVKSVWIYTSALPYYFMV
jgi:hypothetical protein